MPVGDKVFNDLVEHVQEILKSLDIGYPRESWSILSDKMNKLYNSMCRRYKVDVGWRHECDINCPFKPDKDTTHPCCITRDWYRGYMHQNLYTIWDGDRTLNPTYQQLRGGNRLKDDYQIFLNELLSGYWEKERTPKPPGTSAEKPIYRVADEPGAKLISNGTNTDVTAAVIAMSGGYSTTTILGPAQVITPEPDGEDSEDDDEDEQPGYDCEYCGEHYESEHELDRHMDRQHPWCDECERRFSDENAFQEHNIAEHSDDRFGCPVCGDEFDTNDEATAHLASVHSNLPEGRAAAAQMATANAERTNIVITDANTTVTAPPRTPLVPGRRQLVRHENVCNVCQDQFMNARSLRGHRLLAHPQHVHVCGVCGAAFDNVTALGTHLGLEHRA